MRYFRKLSLKKKNRNSRNGKGKNSFCSQENFIFLIAPGTRFLINLSLIKNTYILPFKYWNNQILVWDYDFSRTEKIWGGNVRGTTSIRRSYLYEVCKMAALKKLKMFEEFIMDIFWKMFQLFLGKAISQNSSDYL